MWKSSQSTVAGISTSLALITKTPFKEVLSEPDSDTPPQIKHGLIFFKHEIVVDQSHDMVHRQTENR